MMAASTSQRFMVNDWLTLAVSVACWLDLPYFIKDNGIGGQLISFSAMRSGSLGMTLCLGVLTLIEFMSRRQMMMFSCRMLRSGREMSFGGRFLPGHGRRFCRRSCAGFRRGFACRHNRCSFCCSERAT